MPGAHTWIDERLPRRVTPLQGETVAHYIDRLASANHQDPRRLLAHLCTPRGMSVANVRPERLAAATGRSVANLTHRLHGLHPRDLTRRRNVFIRPACRLCMARRGLLNPVPCQIPPHVTVCRHHLLWIGPDARTHDKQRDVRGLPELLRAQCEHHRLARCYDLLDAIAAQRQAEYLVDHRARRGQWTADQRRRLLHLDPHVWHRVGPAASLLWRDPFLNNTAVKIATYPEVVNLTQLFLTHPVAHHWQWLWARRVPQMTPELATLTFDGDIPRLK